MFLGGEDLKRMLRMMRTRASRGQSSIKQIINLTRQKRPGVNTVSRITQHLQDAAGFLKQIARVIEEMNE